MLKINDAISDEDDRQWKATTSSPISLTHWSTRPPQRVSSTLMCFFEVSVDDDDDDDDGVWSAYFFLILTSTCCSPFLTISVCLTRVIVSQKLIGIQPMNWAMRIENVRSWISDSCFASPGPRVFGPNALCVQQEQKELCLRIFEVQRWHTDDKMNCWATDTAEADRLSHLL